MDTIKLQNIEEIKVNNTKNTVIRYIFMVCGALMLLLALFRLMMGDGIAALSGLPGFFVSWYIASRFRGAESFIEKVNTEIEFGDGYITFYIYRHRQGRRKRCTQGNVQDTMLTV